MSVGVAGREIDSVESNLNPEGEGDAEQEGNHHDFFECW